MDLPAQVRAAFKTYARHYEFDVSGPKYWLWDPEPGELPSGEKAFLRVETNRENRKKAIRLQKTDGVPAVIFAIDKALIPAQPGGQCEGVLVGEQLPNPVNWIELKLNISSHEILQFEQTILYALKQLSNTLSAFEQAFENQGLSFPAISSQSAFVCVPVPLPVSCAKASVGYR